uniref:Uncharacterized protein n=1 Tax=Nelumbo nucifera TaxID=4432 RepID=A0A822ZP39_NELNU|nr:TPA_asm: hypothetical protein HUJ06_002916 [Nelumbo nucifera]
MIQNIGMLNAQTKIAISFYVGSQGLTEFYLLMFSHYSGFMSTYVDTLKETIQTSTS